jgi:phage-related protein
MPGPNELLDVRLRRAEEKLKEYRELLRGATGRPGVHIDESFYKIVEEAEGEVNELSSDAVKAINEFNQAAHGIFDSKSGTIDSHSSSVSSAVSSQADDKSSSIFDAATSAASSFFSSIRDKIASLNSKLNQLTQRMHEFVTDKIAEAVGRAIGWVLTQILEFIVNYILPPLLETIAALAKGIWEELSKVEIDTDKLREAFAELRTLFGQISSQLQAEIRQDQMGLEIRSD